MAAKDISRSTVKRLPTYLSYLKSIPADGPAHISATALAAALGMGEVQVRKDLALVSAGGRPKIGYLREGLIRDLEEFLGYGNTNDAVLVGAGKLGQALLGYGGFAEQLRLAMALSEREQEERERRRREEDEELQRILRLSLTDK